MEFIRLRSSSLKRHELANCVTPAQAAPGTHVLFGVDVRRAAQVPGQSSGRSRAGGATHVLVLLAHGEGAVLALLPYPQRQNCNSAQRVSHTGSGGDVTEGGERW